MAKKKKHTNETSALIVAVGSPFQIQQNAIWIDEHSTTPTLCGLPGNNQGGIVQYPACTNVNIYGQYVVDQNTMVWCYIKNLNFNQYKISNETYPMTFRFCREGFGWNQGSGGVSPTSSWAFNIIPDFSVYVSGGNFDYRLDRPNIGTAPGGWLSIEDCQKGITVDSSNGWAKLGYLTELQVRSDGVHVWYSAIGTYHVDSPVYPDIHEHVHPLTEIPFYYYPGAIKSGNNFIPTNDPGHGLFINKNGSWEDVKNLEGEASNEDKAFIHNNKQYQKILKG